MCITRSTPQIELFSPLQTGASRTLPHKKIKCVCHELLAPLSYLYCSCLRKILQPHIQQSLMNIQRFTPFRPRRWPHPVLWQSAKLTEPVISIIVPQARLSQHSWHPIGYSGAPWMRFVQYLFRTRSFYDLTDGANAATHAPASFVTYHVLKGTL